MNPKEVRQTLQLLKPLYSSGERKKLDLIWAKFQASDEMEQRHMAETVRKIAVKHGLSQVDETILLPPPDKSDSGGDIGMGKIQYLDQPLHDFKLKLSELTRHAGIFGSTGTGKTTLALNLIRELMKKKIPFIIFDWEASYRGLIKEFPEIKVFTVGKETSPFRFNFFEMPPGIAFEEYTKNVIEVFSRCYIGGVGSDTILKRSIDSGYRSGRVPTVEQINAILLSEMGPKKLKGRSGLWKESAQRMLEFLSYGATGRIVNTIGQPPLSGLFDQPVVFELGGLANSHDKRFFVEMITLWYWLYVEHRGIEHETLKHVLVFEEFRNMVENSKEEDLIQKVFRQLRKYGTGIIALDQEPGKLPNGIFENMGTKISFSLDHQQNIRAVNQAMFMDRDQIRFIGLLKKGQAIVRCKERYPYPFLIKVPFSGNPPHVSDEELTKHMRQYSHLSGTADIATTQPTPLPSFPVDEYVPPAGEMILLQAMAREPFMGTDARYKALGLSARSGNEMKNNLVDHGFLEPVQVDRKKLFQLTQIAREFLKARNIPIPSQARGGLEHNYWLERIKEHFKSREGFPFKEKDDIDLVVEHYDSTTLVQVETGKSNIKKNIQTILNHEADQRIMIATNQSAELKIRTALGSLPLMGKEKIQVYSARDFLAQNPAP